MARESRISIKTSDELQILREAGKILAAIVDELKCSLKSGVTTQDVDILAENLMRKHKVIPLS